MASTNVASVVIMAAVFGAMCVCGLAVVACWIMFKDKFSCCVLDNQETTANEETADNGDTNQGNGRKGSSRKNSVENPGSKEPLLAQRRQSTLKMSFRLDFDSISSEHSITADEMDNRRTNGPTMFMNAITQNRASLYDTKSWNILTDYIYQNMGHSQHERLKLLLKITVNSVLNEHPIDCSSNTFQSNIANMTGSDLFFSSIGYEWSSLSGRRRLVRKAMDDRDRIVVAAQQSIQFQIDLHSRYQQLAQDWRAATVHMLSSTRYNEYKQKAVDQWLQYDLSDYGTYYRLLTKLEHQCKSISTQREMSSFIMTQHGFPAEINQIPSDSKSHARVLDAVWEIYQRIQGIEQRKEREEDLDRINSIRSDKPPIIDSQPQIGSNSSIDYLSDDDGKDDDIKIEEIRLEDVVEPISSQYAPKPEEMERFQSNGSSDFEFILNDPLPENRNMGLLIQSNWDKLIESMCSNLAIVSIQEQMGSLRRLKRVTDKVLDGDYKGGKEAIDTGHSDFSRRYHGFVDFDVFLRGIGFMKIAGTFPQYQHFEQNPEGLRPVITVAQSAILKRKAMLQLLQKLHKVWQSAVQIMYDDPILLPQEAIHKLTQMDLVREYKSYYDLLLIVVEIGKNRDYIKDRKLVAQQILQRLEFVQVDECKDETMKSVYAVYEAIRRIEEHRAKQHTTEANQHNLGVIARDMSLNGLSVQPDMMKALSTSPTTLGRAQNEKANAKLLEEAKEFGKYWSSNLDLADLMPSEEELDAIYFNKKQPEAMKKWNELTAYNTQLEELDKLRENMIDVSQFKEQKCDDPLCGWNIDAPSWMLLPNQVFHIMFYHSDDYRTLKKRRRDRYNHTTRGGEPIEDLTPQFPSQSKPESESESKAEQPGYDPNHQGMKQVDSMSMSSKQNDVVIEIEMVDQDEPPEPEGPDEGRCQSGDGCAKLKRVLDSCRDIESLLNAKSEVIDDVDTIYDMDHCLLFHSDFRIDGPPDNCTNPLCLNVIDPSLGMNRFIQFHRQIFHDEPIGMIQIEQKEEQKEKESDDKFKYKKAQSVDAKRIEFGEPFDLTDKKKAKFKDPKAEMLKNEYHPIDKAEWNELLRKCMIFAKSREAKRAGLNLKEIVALKLYTDCDDLQRVFRQCYREKDPEERRKLQRNFFNWNKLLETACKKAKYKVPNRLYHGVNDNKLLASSFNGTYYGPVSTTEDFIVAKSFAGTDGKIIEMYPSFARCGLPVSWLSNFPDEKEVLYMNTSFEILNMFESNVSEPPRSPKRGRQYSAGHQLMAMEADIIRALQTINVGTDILSLNDQENKGCFANMVDGEMMVVLQLLYLQYRTELWDELAASADDSPRLSAILKFRDQFITLIGSVRAVIMNKMSKLLEWFFCAAPNEFDRFQSEKMAQLNQQEVMKHFRPNQSLYFPRIARLFPMAEQLSISGKNWDWSLNQFIQFLETHDLDDHGLALQYIDIEMDAKAAQEKMRENEVSQNIHRLKEMGWRLISPTKLYRPGIKPEPKKPFLRTFTDIHSHLNKRTTQMLFMTQSMRLLLDQTPERGRIGPNTHPVINEMENESDIGTDDEMKEEQKEREDGPMRIGDERNEGGIKIKEVDYDPSNCTLSRQIFEILEYKEDLIQMMKWRLQTARGLIYDDSNYKMDHQKETRFIDECKRVQSLVLDPISSELRALLYDQKKNSRSILSFDFLYAIFPNVKVLFVTSTSFNLTICRRFVHFMRVRYEKSELIHLKKVYFSTAQPLRQQQFQMCQLRLKEIGWEFVESQQLLRRME